MDAGGRQARYVRVQLAEANYLHLLEVEVFGSGTAVTRPQPAPTPVQPVQKFNNYNSGVACSYTDKATFTLKEPDRHATQAALWYDFGNVHAKRHLHSHGLREKDRQRHGQRKGDCAAGYTWCHGFMELGDLAAGDLYRGRRARRGFATTSTTMQETASS